MNKINEHKYLFLNNENIIVKNYNSRAPAY